MPVFSLNGAQSCESCYVLRIGVGGYTSGTLTIEIGNGDFTSIATVSTITANGDYTIDIDPSSYGCTSFSSIRVTLSSPLTAIYEVKGLFQAESCTEPQCSQCFDLAPHNCTVKLEYTNNSNAFNFDYEHFDFVQELRIDGDLRRPRYPETNNQYTTSRGNNIVVSFDSYEVNECRVDLAPQYIHNAIRLARGHREFYIDGIRWTPLQQEYSPEHRNDTTLSQSRFDVRKYRELNQNTNCK